MKSLRLLFAVLFLLTFVNVHAADSKKAASKATPAAKAPDSSGLPDVVAEVEGDKIKKVELLKDFSAWLEAAGQSADKLTADQKLEAYHMVLDEMIIDRILKKRSADIKIDKDEIEKNVTQIKSRYENEKALEADLKKNNMTLDQVREKIRVSLQQEKWIESQIADKVAVSDADAQSFYDKNPDKFSEPETVRASHILFAVAEDAKPGDAAAKEKLAKDTKARIDKGEDFAKLANELSDDHGFDPQTQTPLPKQTQGGDLDYFSHEAMLPEFSDVAFKLKVGEVSDPVKTKYGWHLIKVTDKKPARTIPFAEMKEKITKYLVDHKKREVVGELFTDLKEKSGAKIFLKPVAKAAAPEEQMPPDATNPGNPPAPENPPAPANP